MDYLEAYYPLLENKKRFVVMRGGTGAGKTYHIYMRIILRVLDEKPHIYLCLRKWKTVARYSIWYGMKQRIYEEGLSRYFKFNETRLVIECFNGNQIWFGGVDDPHKMAGIEGVTSIWMEEGYDFHLRDFIELNRRFRAATPHHKEMLISFNPIGTDSWIYQEFFERSYRSDDTLYLQTSYKDNPYLDPEVVKEIKRYKETDEYLYRVYGLGEWGTLSGRIYVPFQVCDKIPENYDDVIYGLDFGFNSPTALIAIYIKDGNYYLEELIYETGLTIEDIWGKMEELKVNSRSYVYCDTAEADSIEYLYRKGVNAVPSKKNVKVGIMEIKRLHKNIFSLKTNDQLHKEVKTYRWKEDKHGNVLDDPIKELDHLLDALRYAIYTHIHNSPEIGLGFALKRPRLL